METRAQEKKTTYVAASFLLRDKKKSELGRWGFFNEKCASVSRKRETTALGEPGFSFDLIPSHFYQYKKRRGELG